MPAQLQGIRGIVTDAGGVCYVCTASAVLAILDGAVCRLAGSHDEEGFADGSGVYLYAYMCMCVCVCVCGRERETEIERER